MSARSIVLGMAVVLACAAAANAQMPGQPTIADLARQTEAARASAETKKARKTYTNKDLKAVPGLPEPAADAKAPAPKENKPDEATQATQANEPRLTPEEEARANAVPEEMWRARAARIREQATQLQETIALLRANPRSPNADKQAQADKEITMRVNALGVLKKQWANLETQARDAKINLAWLEPIPAFPQ